RLLSSNGFGGFSPDGKEYWIFPYGREDRGPQSSFPATVDRPLRTVRQDQGAAGVVNLPPAPWINVVANPFFGFLVSEGGAGYTWAGNSQSNRLTPWNNDPVSDSAGEVVYLRDETTGEYWTPTPLPSGTERGKMRGGKDRNSAPSGWVRHGQGYTIFNRTSNGLEHELPLFAPMNDPVKIIRLKVRNREAKTRKLSATFYCEWVLGTVRDQTALNVVPSYDSESGALLARNAFNSDFAGRVAFAAVSRR